MYVFVLNASLESYESSTDCYKQKMYILPEIFQDRNNNKFTEKKDEIIWNSIDKIPYVKFKNSLKIYKII